MKLVEILEKYKGKKIKIGFNKGSNFIFCDSCDDDTETILNVIEEKKISEIRDTLTNALIKLETLENDGIDKFVESEIERIELLNKKRTAMGEKPLRIPPIEKIEVKYYKSISNLKKSIDKYEKCLSMNHPVLDAEVVEKYKSIYEDNTIIIICAGFITGQYWTVEEYQTGIFEKDSDEDELD